MPGAPSTGLARDPRPCGLTYERSVADGLCTLSWSEMKIASEGATTWKSSILAPNLKTQKAPNLAGFGRWVEGYDLPVGQEAS